jgi:hypothetical protein
MSRRASEKGTERKSCSTHYIPAWSNKKHTATYRQFQGIETRYKVRFAPGIGLFRAGRPPFCFAFSAKNRYL